MAVSHHLDTCWLCGEPMDESKEHVLPESITYGGSLRVSGFICTGCNNTTGTEWDAALASVCRPAFKADQQYPPHLRESGPKFTPAEFIASDGEIIVGTTDYEGNFREDPKKPEEEDFGDGYKRISIQGAVDDKRIYEQIQKLRGKFDINASEGSSEKRVSGIVSHEIEVHRGRIRKALVKSYLALAYHVGIDPLICNKAVPFLRNETVVFIQDPPLFLINERAARYNHIVMIYGNEGFLAGGAHISGFPLEVTKGKHLDEELHVESLVPALLSTQYDGPPVLKAYMVNVKDKRCSVLDIRGLLDDGTIRFNPETVE